MGKRRSLSNVDLSAMDFSEIELVKGEGEDPEEAAWTDSAAHSNPIIPKNPAFGEALFSCCGTTPHEEKSPVESQSQ